MHLSVVLISMLGILLASNVIARSQGNEKTEDLFKRAPLALACPAAVEVNAATGQNTAEVNYPAATPSGGSGSYGNVGCTSASGSTFNAGQTTVTCFVSETTNPGTNVLCSFTVTVNAEEPCEANYRQCGSGECKQSSWFCDSFDDCQDRSDELMCCPETQFNCANGRCIELDARCDGSNDCRDNSDENECAAPLALACPASVQVNSATGLSVTYTAATPSGGSGTYGAVVCTAASGSTFPVGPTTVTCFVSDTTNPGTWVQCSFTVTVNAENEIARKSFGHSASAKEKRNVQVEASGTAD